MTIQDAAERIGRDMDAARLESESADTDRRLYLWGLARILETLGAEHDKAFQAEKEAETDGRRSFCAGMVTAYRDAIDIIDRMGDNTK